MGKTATGQIISTYVRPSFTEIEKEVLDKQIEQGFGKQLSLNMWQVGTYPNRRRRGSYMTDIVVRRDKRFFLTSIPTEKDGTITQLTMAERLLDSEDGDRQGKNRNVLIDCSVDALKVSKPEDKANTYWWFLYPNETDVSLIDDSKTKIVEIIGSGSGPGGAGGKGRKTRALIVGGTGIDREIIANHIRYNFTIKEKQVINNCLIEIVPNTRSYAGCFIGETNSQGDIIGTPKIAITKAYVKNADVIVHECIHALRKFDKTRLPKLRHVAKYSGKDADLEESLTEAETTGREKPFSRGEEYRAGYYHYIKVPNKSSKDMVIEDRVTLTGAKEKGQKGKRVQRSVLLKYPKMNIAKLKLKGRVEAIDTFYEVNRTIPGGGGGDKPGETSAMVHVYNPKGNEKTDSYTDEILKSETVGKITQFHDGKPEVIQKARKVDNFRRPGNNRTRTRKTRRRTSSTRKIGPYNFSNGRLSK